MATTQKRTVDFTVQNEGTIFLLHPLSRTAQLWINDHLSTDRQMFGDAVAVEHRYICSIVDGIRADGLEVR